MPCAVLLTGQCLIPLQRGLCHKRRRVHAPKSEVEGRSEAVQEEGGGDGKGEEGSDIKRRGKFAYVRATKVILLVQ